MAIVEVKVPQLSESVAEATLLQWKKKAGEASSGFGMSTLDASTSNCCNSPLV